MHRDKPALPSGAPWLSRNLVEAIRQRSAPLGGVNLELPSHATVEAAPLLDPPLS